MKSWRVGGEGVLSFPSLDDGCVFKDTVRTASFCVPMNGNVSKKINKYLQYSVHNFSNLLIRIQARTPSCLSPKLEKRIKKRKGDFYFLLTKQLINQLIIEDSISQVWDFYWLIYDIYTHFDVANFNGYIHLQPHHLCNLSLNFLPVELWNVCLANLEAPTSQNFKQGRLVLVACHYGRPVTHLIF